MTPGRVHPRHTRDKVTVRPWAAADDGIRGTWGDPVTLHAQVEHLRKLVDGDDGPTVVSAMTVRVNPLRDPQTLAAVDLEALLAVDSEVTHRGRTSWVLESHAVTRHGSIVHVVATTGQQRPTGGGWWVTVTIHHGGGHDRDGNVRPAVDIPDVPALVVPRSTSDPNDFDEAPAAEADLLLPSGTTIASTDAVTIDDGLLAGRWQVDGIPTPAGDRVKVQIVRTL